MAYDTSSAAPHMNILEYGLPRLGGFTAESVCVREDGCALPLTRGYAKLSSSSLGCGGVYANVASADVSVGYGLFHPECN